MNFRAKYQQGSALAVFAVIVTIALIGALGWIAWQNLSVKTPVSTAMKKGSGKAVDKSTRPSKDGVTESSNPTSDWFLYEDTKAGYSVRLPDGWVVLHESTYGGEHDWLVSRGYDGEQPNPSRSGKATGVTLKPGTRAVVQEVGGPGECYGCRFVMQQLDETYFTGHTKRAPIYTKQGNLVDRYEITATDGGFVGKPGTKLYSYHIHAKAGITDIQVKYAVWPGEVDIVKTVDDLVKSIQFQ